MNTPHGRQVIQPWLHECHDCIWHGWASIGDTHYNLYYCKKEQSIIMRFGNESHEYLSYPKGVVYGSLELIRTVHNSHQ